MGVMRGRKHRHQWGMSCHYLSQHPGHLLQEARTLAASSNNKTSCLTLGPCLLFFTHAFKYFSQDKADHGQPHFTDAEIEAGSSHPRGSAPKHRRSKLHPLLTPNYREKRLHEVFSVPTAPHGQHHTDLSAYGGHQLNINP